MALNNLRKLNKHTPLFTTLSSSHSNWNNHHLNGQIQTPRGGGGGGGGGGVVDGKRGQKLRFLLHGISLPLSRLLHLTPHHTLLPTRFQIPHPLPHTSALSLLSPLPEKILQTLAPDSLYCRGFCIVPNGCSDSDSVAGSESDGENSEGRESENVGFKADPNEVERVCKVIDELFALDRNMEAVLEDCGVNLTHDLVMEVLERFRHARRPALRFFCWAGQRPGYAHDSRTYNKMMFILGKTRQFETMVTVLDEMGERGLLTIETFETAIKAFAEAKERRKAVGMFEMMKKYKFKVGVDTINCLLDALGRAKLGKEAQLLFEKLKERFTSNMRTYTVLLNGWCRVKNLMEAARVWNEMIDKGFKPDIVAHRTMLEGLLKCRKSSDAIKLFEVMKAKGPSPTVRSYTILIRHLCKQMKMKEAVDYFEEMLDSGCEPDAAVYTCLITAFGNQKKMDVVYALLKEMKEKGCPPDGHTYNALIKLVTDKRMPDDAVMVYKEMIKSGFQPTIHTYNMMMKSYFETRNCEMGYEVWEEMNRKGCCPDDNSYIVFIGGLIRQGRSEEACQYLEEMIEKGMKAPQLDYNKFAADFSRAGRPDILKELAQKMKFSGKFEASNVFSRWVKRKPKPNIIRDVKITQWEIYSDGKVIVHGIEDFFDLAVQILEYPKYDNGWVPAKNETNTTGNDSGQVANKNDTSNTTSSTNSSSTDRMSEKYAVFGLRITKSVASVAVLVILASVMISALVILFAVSAARSLTLETKDAFSTTLPKNQFGT